MSTRVSTRAANREITTALTKHRKKSGRSKTKTRKVRISEPEEQEPQEQPNDPEPQREEEGQGETGNEGDGAGGGGDDDGDSLGDGPDDEPQDDPWDEDDDSEEERTFKFGLTPSLAIDDVLDYGTKLGSIRYKEATKSLEKDDLYDCQPEGFFQFMQSVEIRAREEGWDLEDTGIMWLPRHRRGRKYNFLAEYGDFTLAEVTRHERTYVNTETRAAQNDRMLYQCLINSLSVDGKSKVNIWSEDFIIDGDNKVGEFVPSGLCYLKVIIRESYLDSNATELTIRTQLSNLDTHMSKAGNDIIQFNGHVKMLVAALHARNASTQDLLPNLFKGYAACKDRTFVEYIAKKQDEFDEGADMKPNQLMELAQAKYKTLKTREVWEEPTPQEEQVMALQARLEKLNKWTVEHKKRIDKHTPKGEASKKKRKKNRDFPSWMFVKPKESELNKPREWNGSNWYWCSEETGGKCNPGQYRTHLPSACRGAAGKVKKPAKKTPDKKTHPKVVLKETVAELEGGYFSEED